MTWSYSVAGELYTELVFCNIIQAFGSPQQYSVNSKPTYGVWTCSHDNDILNIVYDTYDHD